MEGCAGEDEGGLMEGSARQVCSMMEGSTAEESAAINNCSSSSSSMAGASRFNGVPDSAAVTSSSELAAGVSFDHLPDELCSHVLSLVQRKLPAPLREFTNLIAHPLANPLPARKPQPYTAAGTHFMISRRWASLSFQALKRLELVKDQGVPFLSLARGFESVGGLKEIVLPERSVSWQLDPSRERDVNWELEASSPSRSSNLPRRSAPDAELRTGDELEEATKSCVHGFFLQQLFKNCPFLQLLVLRTLGAWSALPAEAFRSAERLRHLDIGKQRADVDDADFRAGSAGGLACCVCHVGEGQQHGFREEVCAFDFPLRALLSRGLADLRVLKLFSVVFNGADVLDLSQCSMLTHVQIGFSYRIVLLYPSKIVFSSESSLEEMVLQLAEEQTCPLLNGGFPQLTSVCLKGPSWRADPSEFLLKGDAWSTVEYLEISGCRTMEELPKCVLEARGLRSLTLRCLQLSDMADVIDAFKHLRHLHVQKLNLEQLPLNLGSDLLDLESLVVSDMFRMSRLPPNIGDLPSLMNLDLDRCSALLGLPESFSQLTNLSRLRLSCCRMLTIAPTSRQAFSGLSRLIIDSCPPRVLLGSIPHLKQLRFCNPITLRTRRQDVRPELLTGSSLSTAITRLSIARFEALPRNLAKLTNLRVLDIVEGCFFRTLPDALGKLKLLEALRIAQCQFARFPDSAENLERLQVLILRRCSVVEFGPWLVGLKSLRILSIDDCSSLRSIPEIGKLSQLQKLVAIKCPLLELPSSISCLDGLLYLHIDAKMMKDALEGFFSRFQVKMCLEGQCILKKSKWIHASSSFDDLGCSKLFGDWVG